MGTERELTINEIVKINSALGLITDQQLPFKLSFKIGRLKSVVEQIAQLYEEKRVELIKTKYSTDKENPKVPEKRVDEFLKELDKVGQEKDTIKIPELKIEEFEGVKVSPKFFILIGDYITE